MEMLPHAPPLARRDTAAPAGDEYAWLREKANPEVRAYLEAENACTQAVMADTEALRERLYREMVERIEETDQSVPVAWGGFLYYDRTEAGKQYKIWCRRQGVLDAPEEILVDGNQLAEGREYFQLGDLVPDPSHTRLAWSADFEGDENFEIRIHDLVTGQALPDRLGKAAYTLAWSACGRFLFYVVRDAALRPHKVFRHHLGGAGNDDVEVFHEPDERFEVEVGKTRCGRYLLIESSSHTSSECRFLDASEPEGEFRVVLERAAEVEYDVTHNDGWFWLRINDTLRTFRLVKAPVADPRRENWVEMLAARAEVTLEAQDHYRGHLVVLERDRGLLKILVWPHGDGTPHRIEMPEPVYSAGPLPTPEFDTPTLRFHYTSLVTPLSVFDYNMDTRERVLRKRQPVKGGYDPAHYETVREWTRSSDGVEIPVSIVWRKGLVRDGSAPALLYGYGSYGIAIDPAFSSERVSLLDRGFVYAIAHIRGGGDLGKTWHDDGKMRRKKNTFADFIAAAEHLARERWTSPPRLAIMGGSAGGLLIGAVLNQRPDLFGAAIAKVPFVDTLNTMLDASLPLTVGEYEEWGNPAEPEFRDLIASYAPYENVRATGYPHLLVTAGLNDPRVSFWEPAKWVARLRARRRGRSLLLLKTNLGAGHFGRSGRYERFKETAFEYAFLLKALR